MTSSSAPSWPHGGPAPVRRFLPELISLIEDRQIDPGSVFDLTLPLPEAADGYRAMDERRAIKTSCAPDSTQDQPNFIERSPLTHHPHHYPSMA